MNGPLLFLAESLSLCQPLGRLGALLVAELDECLLHHLPLGHVPSLLIHEVGIWDIPQEVRAALPRHQLIVLLVHLLSEGLLTRVGQACRALPKTIVYLVPIVNLREREAWRVAILINISDFVLIECIDKGVLPWSYPINIGSVHHYLRYLVTSPFRTVIARWASTVDTTISLIIRPAPVQTATLTLGWAHTIQCCGVVWGSILEATL